MLSVLTKTSVQKVMLTMSKTVLDDLRKKYLDNTSKLDRREYSFNDFASDLIHQVDYRHCCEEDGLGVDGNWIEFETEWVIGEVAYEAVLKTMKTCGYKTTTDKW